MAMYSYLEAPGDDICSQNMHPENIISRCVYAFRILTNASDGKSLSWNPKKKPGINLQEAQEAAPAPAHFHDALPRR